MTTTIFLVRHGRTKANEEERFAGRTDEPLLEIGKEQAKQAALHLADQNINITAIYASPLVRTIETAQIMAKVLNAPVKLEEGLNEIRIPQWDGRLKTDLFEDHKTQYPIWKKDPSSFALPGAETLQELQTRAVYAMEKIFALHKGENVVAVTHLAVSRCLLLHYSGRPLSEYRTISVANATPIALTQKSDHNCIVIGGLKSLHTAQENVNF